jgi:hypothetical protein
MQLNYLQRNVSDGGSVVQLLAKCHLCDVLVALAVKSRVLWIVWARAHEGKWQLQLLSSLYQAELSAWNRTEQRKLGKWQWDCNTTPFTGSRGSQVFSQLLCSVVL